jgi:hypothetical protein
MAYNKEMNKFLVDEVASSRRFGRIDIADQFIQTDFDTIQKVYSQIVPTEITYDYQMNIFRVKGLSYHFEPVELGSIVPYYQVIVNKDDTGNVTITFKKA